MSQENIEQEVIPEVDGEVNSLVPQLNVSLPEKKEEQEVNLVSDQALLGIFDEVRKEIDANTTAIDEVLEKIIDMVINEGDSTTSSKEAMVNLFKIKTEQADKKTRIAELMTRVKLKDRDTFPRYLAANQKNEIHIGGSGKKALLAAINKKLKQPKKED